MYTTGSFSKRGGPRDPKGYRAIIKGLYRAPLRGYIGVILRNTQIIPALGPKVYKNMYIGLFGSLGKIML